MDNATYDRIVAGLYRAGTGEIGWEDALEQVRVGFEAQNAPVQTVDLRSGSVISLVRGAPGMEHLVLSYVTEYHRIDPRAKVIMTVPPGTWGHCTDYFDDAFMERDRCYQEFLTAYQSRYASGVLIPHDETTASIFGIQRSRQVGPLNEEERVWAMRIGEHLAAALAAYHRVRAILSQALAGHQLLSAFAFPMWLLDADRHIYFLNDAARTAGETGTQVAAGPRLRLLGNRADRELTARLTNLATAEHGATAMLSLSRTASDPPIWLHLSTLVPGQALGAFGDQRRILAVLFDPRLTSSLDDFALSNMFALTPAEARVAARLAEGLSPAEVAQTHGTQMSTVRRQMAHVFAKVGVARQSDLVRILRQGESLWARAGTSATADG